MFPLSSSSFFVGVEVFPVSAVAVARKACGFEVAVESTGAEVGDRDVSRESACASLRMSWQQAYEIGQLFSCSHIKAVIASNSLFWF